MQEYMNVEIDRVDRAFNSRMTDVHRGSDLDEIVDGMIAHMKTQIENPAMLRSGFRSDKLLHKDINFHQLNLTRGSSYLPLPDWIARKKAIVNPKNEGKECFTDATVASLHNEEIKFNTERVSNLNKFKDRYDWSGLEFPLSIKGIDEFEKRNDVRVHVLAAEKRDF